MTKMLSHECGEVYKVTKWEMLKRFLVLGSEEGTYYVGAKKFTKENVKNIIKCVQDDGVRTFQILLEYSQTNRIIKQDTAILVLALLVSYGTDEVKKLAFAELNKIVRIGTHLFQFVDFINTMKLRGFGRGLRKALVKWYTSKTDEALAYQVIKYQNREGWTHKDILRMSHPKSDNSVLRYIVTGEIDNVPDIIKGYELAKVSESKVQITDLIKQYGLTWEMLPTKWLALPEIWEVLLPNLPYTAMLRNLGRMSANGCLKPLSKNINTVVTKILDESAIKNQHVNSVAIFQALRVYEQGKGDKGSLTWNPVNSVVNALNEAFYMSLKHTMPSGKDFLIGLDVSGSMAGTQVTGLNNVSCREACGLVSLSIARIEKNYHMIAFDSESCRKGGTYPITISNNDNLNDVVKKLSSVGGGGTNCYLPIKWAIDNKIDNVDCFVILTDSENWQGSITPVDTLNQYRKMYNKNAKMVIVAMAANRVSIGDHKDKGIINVVGFDTYTPQIISDFAKD